MSNVTVVIIIFVTTLGLNSGIFSGFITSPVDLTPNFAGTITGLENSLSSVTSALGPLVVGFIVTNEVRISRAAHEHIGQLTNMLL